MGPMVKPFWIDRGLSVTEIGLVSTTLGVALSILGALCGGAFTSRFGVFRGLWVLGLAQAFSNLGYAAAAATDSGRAGIYAASAVESFSGGLGTAAFLAFLMRACQKEQAATQYALLSALFNLTRTVANMKVLITGGAGFLGSHLTDAFLDRGDEVFILDTGMTVKVKHRIGHPRVHFVRDSVFNEAILEGLIARVDLVYHLAAVVGVEHYVGDPYQVLNVNVNGTQNVLKLAFKHGKRVVFSSTSEVYGRNPQIPWSEDDDRVLGSTRIDRWCYSTSKAVGEHFCFAYHHLGLPVTVVRYFNIYGPRLDKLDVGRIITIFMSW